MAPERLAGRHLCGVALTAYDGKPLSERRLTVAKKASGIYARLYCSIREHDTCSALSDPAFRLYVCGIAYSRERLTDGFLADHVIARLAPIRKPARAAAELASSDLWARTDDGYQIRDWANHQETRDEVVAKKEAASANGRAGADARWRTDG
jgi:hypothetical protein